tara:strand:- start:44 stop:199 length:156 start_codon:yes stop_codon:yes gene_type:complete
MQNKEEDNNLDHIHDPQDPQEITLADMTPEQAKEFGRKALAVMQARESKPA